MRNIETQKTIINLYREHTWLMEEYADCTKKDNISQVKNKLLLRMKNIEKELKKLESRDGVYQIGIR